MVIRKKLIVIGAELEGKVLVVEMEKFAGISKESKGVRKETKTLNIKR